MNIYDEDELDKLEEEEHAIAEALLLLMFLHLTDTHKELETELRAFYQEYGKDGVITYAEARKWISRKNHKRRITHLLYLVSGYFIALKKNLTIEFSKLIDQVLDKEIEFFDVDIDEIDMKWGSDNLTWFERLADDVILWQSIISADLKRAFHKRQHLDELLETLDKRFISMEKVLTKLGLTETTAAGSLARKEAFKELGVTKYRFYAREDERTCDECGSLHGLTFPISAYEVGVTASPIHAHCRCWEVPIRE